MDIARRFLLVFVLFTTLTVDRGTSSLAAQGGGAVIGGGGGAGRGVTLTSPPPLPTGTGAISGVVADGFSRRPVPNAIVSLRVDATGADGRISSQQVIRQLTDAIGRFVFTDLPPSNTFLLTAQRVGYFGGTYGGRPGERTGTPIALADGEWFSRADITVWPTSAITGRLTDEYGDPIVGAYVRVLRQILVGGTRRLAAAPPATTDDRGVYRIGGLDPGRYVVCVPSLQSSIPATTPFPREPVVDLDRATRVVAGRYPVPSADVATVYPGTCYPGVTSVAQAAAVEVRFGADRSDVDFRLQAVRGWRVSGRVDGLSQPLGFTVRLLPAGSEGLGFGSEAATALVGGDGAFVLVGVPAGEYVLEARNSASEFTYTPEAASRVVPMSWLPVPPVVQAGGMSATDVASSSPRTGVRTHTVGISGMWGRQIVSVGAADVHGVVVALQQPSSITGRIVFDGSAKPASAPIIAADGTDGTPPRARSRPTETNPDAFALLDLMPGQYFVRVTGLDEPWVVQSIIAAGRDYSRVPFDLSDGGTFDGVVVTMTDRAATVGGTVRDGQGRPLTNAAVLLFPTDRDAWRNFGLLSDRIRSTRPTSAGAYRFAGLVPGDYHIVAVEDHLINAWHDPAFLESVAAAAARVNLVWSQERNVDLMRLTVP